jgi:hypothetical protein
MKKYQLKTIKFNSLVGAGIFQTALIAALLLKLVH